MPRITGLKVSGTVSNTGEMAWTTLTDIRASIIGSPGANGWATKLGLRCGKQNSGDPTATIELGLYTASGGVSGTVDNLVADTADIAVTATMSGPSNGAMMEAALPAGTKLQSALQYAVAAAVKGGSIRYGQGGVAYKMHFKNGTGAFPNPFAADSTSTENQIVAWVESEDNVAPVATIAGPVHGSVVSDTTPAITVGFTDANTAQGDSMAFAQIWIYQSDGTTLVETSTKVGASGASHTWSPAGALSPGVKYVIKAQVWDQYDVASAQIGGVGVWEITINGGGTVSNVRVADHEAAGTLDGDTVVTTTTPTMRFLWTHSTAAATATIYWRLLDADTATIVRTTASYSASAVASGATADLLWTGWVPITPGTTRYRFETQVLDALGGLTPWTQAAVAFVVDPAPTVGAVATGATIGTALPTATVTVTDAVDEPAFVTVTLAVNGAGAIPMAHIGSGTYSYTLTGAEMPTTGTYSLAATATDPWGHVVTGNPVSYTLVDPPTITLVAPIGTIVDPTPTIDWTLSNTQASYQVTIRDAAANIVFGTGTVLSAETVQEVIGTYLADGTYELTIAATDSYGLVATPSVTSFTVATGTAPTLAEDLALVVNAGLDPLRAEDGEIVLDGVRVPVMNMQRTDLRKFEGKLTFGDYTIDSDQLLSTFAQSNWAGGMLVAEHQEGATDTRFRWARAWTLGSRQLTVPLQATAYDLSWANPPAPTQTTETLPLGMTAPAPRFYPWYSHPRAVRVLGCRNGIIYAACGKRLSAINGETGQIVVIGDLAAAPVNRGAFHSFDGRDQVRLYIPLGEFGIQYYQISTNTLSAANTDVDAVAVASFDTKVFAATTDGYVRKLTAAGWVAPTEAVQLPGDEYPRHILSFFDTSGQPCPVIVTDTQLWVYSDDADELAPHGLHYTRGPHAGEGAAVWRGNDAIWIADGLEVTRSSVAGVITPTGLDRDDGFQMGQVPTEEGACNCAGAFRITSLAGSVNLLLATVRGSVRTVAGLTTSRNVVLGFNDAGWAYITASDRVAAGTDAFEPIDLTINDGLGSYQAVWGETHPSPDTSTTAFGRLWVCGIPENVHAPSAPVQGLPVTWADEGILYTGWIDAGMVNFWKGWSHVEVNIEPPEPGVTIPEGEVDVYYRTEGDPTTLVPLGTTAQIGRNVFSFRLRDGIHRGLLARKIEVVLVPKRGAGALELPLVSGLVIKFLKLSQPGAAWRALVPLDRVDTVHGIGPTELSEFLGRLAGTGSRFGPFSKMVHRLGPDGQPKTYRCRVTQWQAMEQTAENPAVIGTLNLIAIPIDDEGI